MTIMDLIDDSKQASPKDVSIKQAEMKPPSVNEAPTGDLIVYGDVDPALAAKMHLLNQVRALKECLKN
jgi:hypothetical protein